MAELTPQERLQPALLDRLTDDDRHATAESREQRVLSMQRLRAALLRDLGWLLNTGHLATFEDLEQYPEVARSVLNYGIPDFSGLTVDGADTARIEKAVRQAVMDFEPRIAPGSLRVAIQARDANGGRSALVFRIEGELWAKPSPQALYLKTEIDLETGNVTVSEGQS